MENGNVQNYFDKMEKLQKTEEDPSETFGSPLEGFEFDMSHSLKEGECMKESEPDKASSSSLTATNGSVELMKEIEHNSVNEDSDERIAFEYNDWDVLENELAEIYGYYELDNFSNNLRAFNSLIRRRKNVGIKWQSLEKKDRISFIHDLLDQLEIANRLKQLEALLALNYIVQGCWGEFITLSTQLHWTEVNVELLLECDAFWCVLDFFKAVSAEFEGGTVSDDDLSVPFFEISLNILCSIAIVTVVKTSRSDAGTLFQALLDETLELRGGELAIFSLLNVFNLVKNVSTKCFLVKKLLLLIRSVLLLTLGGSDELSRLKELCRRSAGLKPIIEDTIQTCKNNVEPLQKSSVWSGMKAGQNLMTWTEFSEAVGEDTTRSSDSKKSLPWTPKSSVKSLQLHTNPNDALPEENKSNHSLKSLEALPVPVKQRIELLIQYLHVPLGDHQVEQERLVSKYPNRFSGDCKPFVEKTERVFESLLPILEETIRSLVTILSEATPRKRMKQRLFVPKTVTTSFTYSSSEDSRRQAEIIAKSISAILLLLLKHYKINHIYQFECISAEIVAASFIPTALRYFNRDVEKSLRFHRSLQNVSSRYQVMNGKNGRLLDFDRHKSSAGCEDKETFCVSWRNLFAYINLLRILNKIMKEKPSRILVHSTWI
ncbi:unnamed protein product [Orchesella dallaii]|uniref:Uncharacterized protein n=1 Tax=Orchesella dallaii TaxID=48710 RepID=A0ABP1PYQ9_9HEXA